MKQFTTLLLLLTLLLSVLASCQGEAPTGSLPQTQEESTEAAKKTLDGTKEKTLPLTQEVTQEETAPFTQEDTSIPKCITSFYQEGTVDGRHVRYYGHLDLEIFRLLGLDKVENNQRTVPYIDLFQTSNAINYGDVIDYYQIPKEEFIKCDEELLSLSARLQGLTVDEVRENEMDLSHLYDVWYSPDYVNHPWLIHPDFVAESERLGRERKSVIHRYEPDTVHTNLYYTIDWQLIEAVGAEKFAAYETEFAGTENYNVLHFLSYFEIDKEEYLTLFPERMKPYNPDYIYGTKVMQDLYFCRHPMKTTAS